jgi:hypothetical protein
MTDATCPVCGYPWQHDPPRRLGGNCCREWNDLLRCWACDHTKTRALWYNEDYDGPFEWNEA